MSHGIFLAGWATCLHTKKIKVKFLVEFLDEILSLKNKSCIIEKIPVPALRFAYSDSYNNYVKIVSAITRQTKLKKVLIKQKHVIRIILYVNEETHARQLFQELNILDIHVFYKKTIFCLSLNFLNIMLEIRLRFS